MTNSAAIIALINREGPKHIKHLCVALKSDYLTLGPIVTRLVRTGKLVVLGAANEAGYTDIKAHAPMYGTPGQSLVNVRPRREKTKSGSGQVAGPITIGRGSHWGAGLA